MPEQEKYYWKYTSFDDWLIGEKFAKQNPHVLDDDYPDAYDNWVSEADPTELIAWADEYHAYQVAREKQEVNKWETTDA